MDPPTEDPFGHGTHVAGIVAAPLNGVGIGGVAPKARLVNIRAAQDSGYFFLKSTVDALTYAGDIGIDVVNMSFYVDPWLYNCANLPSDSPEQQAEQRTIIEGIQAALRYAHKKGVTLVASAGNQDDDLGDPEPESTSPDFPGGTEIINRDADDSCLTLPTEGDNVIAVTSLGPSKRKAYYSNYGISEADLSAPGGDTNDNPPPAPASQVLAPYPKTLAEAQLTNPANAPFFATDGQRQLLALPPGHLDVLAARGGRRGARRRRVRQARQAPRRADARPADDGEDHAQSGHGHPVPGAAPVRLPAAPQHRPVHGGLRGLARPQRVLRRRHRERRRGRREGPPRRSLSRARDIRCSGEGRRV